MSGNQRWRDGRHTFRPEEAIATRLYDVAELASDATAKAFVNAHHYSGSYPAARFRFGLYRGGDLHGVAVFSQPPSERVLAAAFPAVPRGEAVELGRFVLLDEVPGNGETWFLARAFDLLRGRVRGVVSFSDPCARTAADGRRIFPGHVGTIYQAFNGRYTGRASARLLRLLPDGAVFSERSMSKIRRLERGWRYCAAQLQRHGAGPLPEEAPAAAHAWLWNWLPRLTRTLKHPGNHRYLWALDRHTRRALPAGLPFPKIGAPS